MGTLRAGVASTDITPDLGCHLVGYFEDRVATHIHDQLLAKAMVLDNGHVVLAVVTCDLISMPRDVVVAAKKAIGERIGIPASHVLICSTHTHTGPSAVGALGTPPETEYAWSLVPKISDAVVMAYEQRVPAALASCSGDCSGEVHNRRWHMKDGTVRMNPGYQNPDAVAPAGPTDPELGIVVVRRTDGDRRPLGVLANLALHYVGNGKSTWVSADYFGEVQRALSRFAGVDTVVLMTNGCQGNINNCDFSRAARQPTGPYGNMTRVANVVAAEIWKCWNGLREDDFAELIELDGRIEMMPFRARCPSARELEAAEQLFADATAPHDSEWLYAREVVLLSQMPTCWDVPVQALRIGDIAVAGLHGEVFVEVGLAIKERSAGARTLVVGLANGSIGYVATDAALQEGSYETRLCRHVRAPRGTAEMWTDAAVGGIQELFRK